MAQADANDKIGISIQAFAYISIGVAVAVKPPTVFIGRQLNLAYLN